MNPKSLLYALPALLLASCANDEPATNPDSAAAVVKAEIGELSSRASGTQWDADDQIGISGTSASTTYLNVPYQTDGSGVFTPSLGFANGIIYQDADEVTFSAYYPYNKDVTAENTRIYASTENQADARDFDFLFASGATGSRSNSELNFSGKTAFAHRMAQLVINVTADSDNGFADVDVLSNATYTLSSLRLDGEFDTATGIAKYTSTTSQEISIDPGLATIKDRTATLKLILFPQTARVELCIVIEGAPYTCTFSPRLDAGKAYIGNFTLKRSGLTLGNFAVSDWVADGGTYTGNVTTAPQEIEINGHEGVLMRAGVGKYGDPDYVPALYMATCNIGATTPYEAGLYFWWGDVVGHAKDMGFYFGEDNSEIISKTTWKAEDYYNAGMLSSPDITEGVLTPEYDAATQQWGGLWRMMTYAEMEWFVQNTTVEARNGFNIFTSIDTGNSVIFLRAGHYVGTLLDSGGDARSWGSQLKIQDWGNNDIEHLPYHLYTDYHSEKGWVYDRPYTGSTIRPVITL